MSDLSELKILWDKSKAREILRVEDERVDDFLQQIEVILNEHKNDPATPNQALRKQCKKTPSSSA